MLNVKCCLAPKEAAAAERAGFIGNVRRVTAADGWICVGDTLLGEIPRVCIIHSDRFLKSPNRVSAVGPRRKTIYKHNSVSERGACCVLEGRATSVWQQQLSL